MSAKGMIKTLLRTGLFNALRADGITGNNAPAVETWLDEVADAIAGGEQPKPVEPYEKYSAIREGHRIYWQQLYFDARPGLDTSSNRALYKAAFDHGYDAAKNR